MEHRAIPNLGKEGDITPTQTTGRGAGQDSQVQQAAGGKGSMAKAPIGHIGLLSGLGEGFVPGKVSSKARPLFDVPSWVGDRGEDT